MNSLTDSQKTTIVPLLIALVLVCFAISPMAKAVVPPPDGGYANFTTAEGTNALKNLTSGAGNTAVGWYSLFSDTTASFNTALGAGALIFSNADSNTAVGATALFFNTGGGGNTAVGTAALFNNTEGGANTANGLSALAVNTTGNGNTAVGNGALHANTTGSNNIGLGVAAGTSVTTANNVICIGANVVGSNVVGENGCYIGNIHGAWINPGTVLNVGVDADGKLGTNLSSRRFKHDIKPMDKTSEVLLALKPVTFHYKHEVKSTPCFGLVAEDVEKVNPHLVVRDKNGELLSVRYEAVNAMLLNEFLKEHRKVEQQRKDFEAALARQQKQIEALTAGLQKVSVRLELSKAASQTVLSKQ